MTKLSLIAAAALMTVPATLPAQDDFGIWATAGVEKKIDKKWSVGAEAEYRSRDNLQQTDRWSIGVETKYRIFPWLKAGAGYDFIYANNPEHTTYKKSGRINKIRSSWWGPRHRLHFDLTGSLHLGRFGLSLRERWQYTYRASESSVARYDCDDEEWETCSVRGKGKNVLRSRLMAEYDIPHIPVTPYVSAELYNAWSVVKVRYTAGADWKVSKHHSIGIYYRYIHTSDEDDTNSHILGATYKFRF